MSEKRKSVNDTKKQMRGLITQRQLGKSRPHAIADPADNCEACKGDTLHDHRKDEKEEP